jgi:hypothetical protein
MRAGSSADSPLLDTVSPRGDGNGESKPAFALPEFEIRGYQDDWVPGMCGNQVTTCT